jgi:prepilin-type N-terminal cleavage/methylation domain-containing protein
MKRFGFQLRGAPPAPTTSRRPGRGFTLLEVVLALALATVVIYLMTTAMELYLYGVEASRTRVESAQLARTLLDQIAADLTAMRTAPASSPGGGGQTQQGPGGSSGGGAGGMSPSGAYTGGQGGATGGGTTFGGGGQSGSTMQGGGTPSGVGMQGASMMGQSAAIVQTIIGTVDQIRIDRAALAAWERAARAIELQEPVGAIAANVPTTVHYYFVADNRTTTQEIAEQGVAQDAANVNSAGLYRETIPTAAMGDETGLTTTTSRLNRSLDGAKVELLAPEVVDFSLAYFDGVNLLDEWDPLISTGLPRGVEIRLTLAEPSFQPTPDRDEQDRLAEGRYRESELVEYRRFVRLPSIEPAPAAQPLLPTGQGGGGQVAAGGPGGQGQGGQGGGQQGGQPQGGQP